MTHELKCWPEFFKAVQDWDKLFEIRHNDRDFNVGDTLWMREWNPSTQEYTGQSVIRGITYITDFPSGLKDGYVCMGLEAEHAAHDSSEQRANQLHEALHKTGRCPLEACGGIPDDWKMKIFTHKHLDPKCVESGCQSEQRDSSEQTIREQKEINGQLEYALKRLLDYCDLRHCDPSDHQISHGRAILEKVATIRSGR